MRSILSILFFIHLCLNENVPTGTCYEMISSVFVALCYDLSKVIQDRGMVWMWHEWCRETVVLSYTHTVQHNEVGAWDAGRTCMDDGSARRKGVWRDAVG